MKYSIHRFLPVIWVVLILTACTEKAVTPILKSSFMGKLTWQTDGVYGYRMLRPVDWQALNMGGGRGYSSQFLTGYKDFFMLIVSNPEISVQGPQQFASMKTANEQYQAHPTLKGWMNGLEQVWKDNGVVYKLELKFSNSRIYSLIISDNQVQLIGYVVDKQGPLVIEMNIFGAIANIVNLRTLGFVNEFSDIVTGAGSIPSDPKNINPPFPEVIN
jgi:hypothetical protein